MSSYIKISSIDFDGDFRFADGDLPLRIDFRIFKERHPEVIELSDMEDEFITDYITEEFGWCVNGLSFEVCKYMEGDEVMAMCEANMEKMMSQIEEGKDKHELDVKRVFEKLFATSGKPSTFFGYFTYDAETGEIGSPEGKPFPMEEVIKYINGEIDELKETQTAFDDGELKCYTDWADDLDFDIEEAEELINKKEDGELYYEEDVNELLENKIGDVFNSEFNDLDEIKSKLDEMYDEEDLTTTLGKWIRDAFAGEFNNLDEIKSKLDEMKQFHEWDKVANLRWNEAKDEIEKLKEEVEKLKGNQKEEKKDVFDIPNEEFHLISDSGESEEETPKERKEEIHNKLASQLENPFHPVGLEKADMENDTKYFQKVIDDGHLTNALYHMKMTEPVFGEYKNFRKFINEMNKPKAGCDMPFPPPQQTGVYKQSAESIEEEEEMTKQYIKDMGIPTKASIKHFLDNYEGDNEAVAYSKKWFNSDRDYMIYDSVKDILTNAGDDEKVKAVGEYLYRGCNHIGALHMEAMRSVFYIVSWFMKSSNSMCISAYPREVEHIWDGIGEWMA